MAVVGGVVYTPNPVGLAHLLQEPTGAVARWVTSKTVEVKEAAQARAPVQTGRLRSSIVGRVEFGPLRGEVEATAPYAAFVHEGTSPHQIVPVNAQVLRFPSRGGGIVYTTQVNHPGTRAQPFLFDALAAVIV